MLYLTDENIDNLKKEKNASRLVNKLLNDYYAPIGKREKQEETLKKGIELVEESNKLAQEIETDDLIKIKDEVEDKNDNYTERDIQSKVVQVKIWTGLDDDNAKKLALEYLNYPAISRPKSVKEFLIMIGSPIKEKK